MRNVNYASAEFILPWNLTVWENLLVYAKLYEVSDAKKTIFWVFNNKQFSTKLNIENNVSIKDISEMDTGSSNVVGHKEVRHASGIRGEHDVVVGVVNHHRYGVRSHIGCGTERHACPSQKKCYEDSFHGISYDA